MANYPKALDHLLAAWNEPNSTLVRGHIDQAVNSNVRFVDPSIDVTGVDGLFYLNCIR